MKTLKLIQYPFLLSLMLFCDLQNMFGSEGGLIKYSGSGSRDIAYDGTRHMDCPANTVEDLKRFVDTNLYFFCLRDLGWENSQFVELRRNLSTLAKELRVKKDPIQEASDEARNRDLALSVDQRIQLLLNIKSFRTKKPRDVLTDYFKSHRVCNINENIICRINNEGLIEEQSWPIFSYFFTYPGIFSDIRKDDMRKKFIIFMETSFLLPYDLSGHGDGSMFEGLRSVFKAVEL